MTDRSITHATFTIERVFAAPPARVFAAFADPKAKARWFNAPEEWISTGHQLDFRIGGSERTGGGPKGGPTHSFEARFYDIVPNERIVSTYEMYFDKTRISVSLSTVELEATEAGTRMTYTEAGAYLDGYDDSGKREHGTRELFNALEASLKD